MSFHVGLLYPAERVPVFGAIDPGAEEVRWVREALGSDVVELASGRGKAASCHCCVWLPVRVASLASPRQFRVARELARRNWPDAAARPPLDLVLFEINYGVGLWLLSKHVFPARDPDVGRAYWADRAAKGGGP